MTPLTDDHPWRRTPRGSVECTITIVLNPSGMARFKGKTKTWPMRDDHQVVGNVWELIAEGRRQL